jgi:predicted phosphodiesterase
MPKVVLILARQYDPGITLGVDSSNKSLIVMISDVHWGKKTESGFCAEVATERILSIPDKIDQQLNGCECIDEIVVLFLGDQVEGEDIFDTQNSTLELPVILQSKVATLTFWKLLNRFSELFGVPVRVETVPGNHGRMSKTASKVSNWDNSIYQTLGILSSMNETDIAVNVNLKSFNTTNIKGHKLFLNHQGVKHTGTPAMKIKFAGWIISKEIDYLIHGHWHNVQVGSFIGRKTVGNGSVCGPDDLSEKMASEEPPAQVFFLLESGKRLNNIHLIDW